jgi:hypothetical protein
MEAVWSLEAMIRWAQQAREEPWRVEAYELDPP